MSQFHCEKVPCRLTPRSNFCLLAPTLFSLKIPPFCGVDPAGPWLGWAPTNKILHGKPTPRSNFCLLAPAQFLTLQGISDRVSMGGTPGGWHFGSPPGSVPSPGEMRSPRQILGWWLVWVRRQAAGHTHIHTHFHLYVWLPYSILQLSLLF